MSVVNRGRVLDRTGQDKMLWEKQNAVRDLVSLVYKTLAMSAKN